MDLSYQSIRTVNRVREADELRTETRRRNLLVLIYHHLLEEGYMDSAKALEKESSLGLMRFEVCDNVDLDTVLLEYESYYFIKFRKYPKLTKKLPEQGESRLVKGCGKRRISSSSSSSSSQTLPRIDSIQRPPSSNTVKRSESKLTGSKSQEGNSLTPVDSSGFGLNVSAIVRNGAEEGTHLKKGHQIDYRNLIQDAVKGAANDTDFSERLLKPLSAFIGMNSDMRELAAVISRDIYLHNLNVRWDDIIGLEAAKRLVKEAVVYPIKVLGC